MENRLMVKSYNNFPTCRFWLGLKNMRMYWGGYHQIRGYQPIKAVLKGRFGGRHFPLSWFKARIFSHQALKSVKRSGASHEQDYSREGNGRKSWTSAVNYHDKGKNSRFNCSTTMSYTTISANTDICWPVTVSDYKDSNKSAASHKLADFSSVIMVVLGLWLYGSSLADRSLLQWCYCNCCCPAAKSFNTFIIIVFWSFSQSSSNVLKHALILTPVCFTTSTPHLM